MNGKRRLMRIFGFLQPWLDGERVADAIGARLPIPAGQVISIVGRPAAGAANGRRVTAQTAELPVKVIVFKTKSLAFVENGQEIVGFPILQPNRHNSGFRTKKLMKERDGLGDGENAGPGRDHDRAALKPELSRLVEVGLLVARQELAICRRRSH